MPGLLLAIETGLLYFSSFEKRCVGYGGMVMRKIKPASKRDAADTENKTTQREVIR